MPTLRSRSRRRASRPGWRSRARCGSRPDVEEAAHDPRLKLLALAERDEIRAAADVVAEVASWANTRIEVIPGASHFFVGSTDRLVTLARGLVDELA